MTFFKQFKLGLEMGELKVSRDLLETEVSRLMQRNTELVSQLMKPENLKPMELSDIREAHKTTIGIIK